MDELEALYNIESKLERYRHPRSHYYLGVLFLKRHLYEEAIKQFKLAIEQDNSFVKAYMALGISYLKFRQFKAALNTFERALSVSEKYPDFLIRVAAYVTNWHQLSKDVQDEIIARTQNEGF